MGSGSVPFPSRWDASLPPHYWCNNASATGGMVGKQLWVSTVVGGYPCSVLRIHEGGGIHCGWYAPPSILVSEVAINSRSAPTAVRLRLRRTKTDPFGRGVEIYLGVPGTAVCPVTALMRYLAVRPSGDGQLFMWENSQRLTRTTFVTHLRRGLQSAGSDMSQFSGHSLRIGAATSVAAAGVPDHPIKTLGRWRSEAYHL